IRRAIVAISREVRIGHHVYPDIPLDALVDALLARAAHPLKRAANIAAAERYPRDLPADDQPVAPSDIATAINDLFARNGAMPIAADMGDCLFTAIDRAVLRAEFAALSMA